MSTGAEPPFSVVEFGNLVALALESDLDRLSLLPSESFLLSDPGHSHPTATSPSSGRPVLAANLNTRAAGSLNLNNILWRRLPSFLSSSPSAAAPMQSSWTDSPAASSSSTLRPRIIIDKIKHKASALVLRTSELASTTAAEKPRLHPLQTKSKPTRSAHASSSASVHSRHSFFDDDQFAPYLPLVAQYDRAAAAASSKVALSPRKSPKQSPGVAIFSRPASIITSPPSPTKSSKSRASRASRISQKSINSVSTTASSAAPITPTHDAFLSPSAAEPDAMYRYNTSRWSLCTDESVLSAASSATASEFSYPNHPFASSHDVTAKDPFAKGHVQVVRHSAGSGEFPIGSYAPQYASPKQRKRRTGLNQVPAPQGPLPNVPPGREGGINGKNQKVLRIRVAPATAFSSSQAAGGREDWTLSLPQGVAVPRSPRKPTTPPAQRSSNDESSDALAPEASVHTPGRKARARSFLSTSSASTSSISGRSLCPSAWHPSPPPSPSSHTYSLPSLPFPAPPTHILGNALPSLPSPSTSSFPPSTSAASASSRPPPPRPPRSRSRATSHQHMRPPKTADSTASTESTDSTATITPITSNASSSRTSRHRERALAALTGSVDIPSPFVERDDDESESRSQQESESESEEEDSAPYYTARSSFATVRSATPTPTVVSSTSTSSSASFRSIGLGAANANVGGRALSQNFGSAWGCRVSVNVRVRADSGVRPVEF